MSIVDRQICPNHGETWFVNDKCDLCKKEQREQREQRELQQFKEMTLEDKFEYLFNKVNGYEH